MLVQHSASATPADPDPAIRRALDSISRSFLRDAVHTLAIPRHADLEPDNNRLTAHWIARQLRAFGYETNLQGEFANVIARLKQPPALAAAPCTLVGAHYDSVPGCPGADDNASAVAAMLACAKAVADHAPHRPICFASFNREEDGLRGSADFVENVVQARHLNIREATSRIC
ncbi:MAG TPA: M28 family peptidase [Verrucomicrobiae bacterium]|nr:M28 family peptidase [Verrucomicrobiae bacterium]